MTTQFTICVGTIGEGVWHSTDAGEHWRRCRMKLPFHAQPGEIQIRSLSVSPHDPHRILAGSEAGLYRSDDNGANWELIESPMDGTQIWSVAWHPGDRDVIFAGTKPPAIFRSNDGGKKWEKLAIDIAKECFAGPPKVTNVAVDPRDHRTVWASVEIDGIYRSKDGGDTWTHLRPLGEKMLNSDMHGFALCPASQFKILATTPDGIWSSVDDAETWSLHGFPKFGERDAISYCRGIAVKPDDPNVVLVGNGDSIPGKIGAIQRTTDGGKTWSAANLSAKPNSVIYWLATHPADPNVVVANSLHGYVYTSLDAGQTWNKLAREFGEIRSIAWMPN